MINHKKVIYKRCKIKIHVSLVLYKLNVEYTVFKNTKQYRVTKNI